MRRVGDGTGNYFIVMTQLFGTYNTLGETPLCQLYAKIDPEKYPNHKKI